MPLAAAVGAGCASPALTSKPPAVRFVGTENVKTLESAPFLECVTPEADELFSRKLQRSSMSRPLYYSDKANRDQPVELEVPRVFTLSRDAFTRLERDGVAVRPEVELQVRERRKVLVAKVYETTTPLHDAKDNLVRTDVRNELYPRFYDWLWHPECRVVRRRAIHFQVRQPESLVGLVTQGQGIMDDFGRIVFDLRPYMDAVRDTGRGLHITFSCPADGLLADVVIPRETFMVFP